MLILYTTVAFLALLGFSVYYLYSRRRKKQREERRKEEREWLASPKLIPPRGYSGLEEKDQEPPRKDGF